MLIGVPKEIKNHEYRVGLTPAMTRNLVEAGHLVIVQTGAGTSIGYSDAHYKQAGADVVETARDAYNAEMVIKVKEPQPEEFDFLKEGQILFCYLHLAPDSRLTEELVKRKVIGVAYETVTDKNGRLPLLVPMSEIAGRTAIQVGATALQMNMGGKGVLLGGVPGVFPAKVLVIGGGIVGIESARMALGMGAHVTVVDRNLARLRELDTHFGPSLKTLYSSPQSIEDEVSRSDLVVGSVLVPGKTAPKLVTREMIKKMTPGSVIVDVAIDQGGCFETSKVTTHDEPTYIVDEVVHYCVANIPALCALTSTQALTNATMDYALMLANKGFKGAFKLNPGLRNGLNVYLGSVTNEHVAEDLGYEYIPAETVL